MRKLFLLCFSVLIFISCDFNGDDTNSVPHTDNSLFVKENSVIFPIGTPPHWKYITVCMKKMVLEISL